MFIIAARTFLKKKPLLFSDYPGTTLNRKKLRIALKLSGKYKFGHGNGYVAPD